MRNRGHDEFGLEQTGGAGGGGPSCGRGDRQWDVSSNRSGNGGSLRESFVNRQRVGPTGEKALHDLLYFIDLGLLLYGNSAT